MNVVSTISFMWQSHNEYTSILLANNMKKHDAYDWSTVNTSYTGPAPWLTWWTGCSGTGQSCPALGNCHLYAPAVSSLHHHVICCCGTSWNSTPGDMSVFSDHAFAPSWASTGKTARQRKKSSRQTDRQTDRLPSTQCPLFQVQLHSAPCFRFSCTGLDTLSGGKTCQPKACCKEGRCAGPKHAARREDMPTQSMLQRGKTCRPKACCKEGRHACPKHVASREDLPAQSMLQWGKTCRPKACCKEGRCAGPKHVARREDVHAQSMLQAGKTCQPEACCKEGRYACPKHAARREDTHTQSSLLEWTPWRKVQPRMKRQWWRPQKPLRRPAEATAWRAGKDLRLRPVVS